MITKEIAVTLKPGTTLYHKTARNSDGTAARARVNGQCQVWTTRPAEFRLPMKWGLKGHFNIGPSNAADWTMDEPMPLDLHVGARVEHKTTGAQGKVVPSAKALRPSPEHFRIKWDLSPHLSYEHKDNLKPAPAKLDYADFDVRR